MEVPTMKSILIAICLSVALAGCQSLPGGGGHRAFALAPGSTVTLNAPVPVKKRSSKIYIMSGETYSRGGFSFEPACRLDLRSVADASYDIQPQTWTVRRTNMQRGYFVRGSQPLMFAGPIRGFGGDQPSHVTFATNIVFEKETSNEVIGLTCGQLADGYGNNYLPLEVIQGVLGSLVTLEPLATQ
jgi:hypothetical protein